MDNNFEKYSQRLVDALNGKATNQNFDKYQGFDYFVKGDISGIQEFIFNVKSRGAAKTLKGKSLYVQATSELCLAFAGQHFGESNIKLLYNGGGDFYFFLRNADEQKRDNFKIAVLKTMLAKEIYIDITFKAISDADLNNFGEIWSAINKASLQNQMRQNKGVRVDELFKPFDFTNVKESIDWNEFTTRYNKKESVVISNRITPEHEPQLFDLQYHFSGTWSDTNSKLPTWTNELKQKYIDVISEKEDDANYNHNPDWQIPSAGNLIEFDYLARFAAARCGTSKLGVLKMDVDNLGTFFDKRTNINELEACSKSLAWFFEEYLIKDLLKKEFEYLALDLDANKKPQEYKISKNNREVKYYKVKKEKSVFFENIYVIFSGGDDCFLLGAWDAVFAFAKLVHNEFNHFTCKNKDISLSASLVLVDAKFPVVQFAKLADKALKKAKDPKLGKHKIALMGEVFSWDDFEKIEKIALDLQQIIIEKREPRGILDKIRLSARGFLGIQNKLEQHQLPAPKVWRLLWYLKGSKNKEDMESLFQKHYIKPLLSAYVSKQLNNPMLFPIAARWAEFLTRKKS